MKSAALRKYATSVSLLVLFAASAAVADEPREKWVAPRSVARVTNPIPATPESVKAGLAVYRANCVSCHGETGKGDGILVPQLSFKPANLSDVDVWKQSDGAIFWKVSTGRQPMPPWGAPGDAGIPDEDRWNVINYLRATFAPKGVAVANPAVPVPNPANPLANPPKNTVPVDRMPETPEEYKALVLRLLREHEEMRTEIEQLKGQRGAPSTQTGTTTVRPQVPSVASGAARQDDLEDVQKQVDAIKNDLSRVKPGIEGVFIAGDAFVGFSSQRRNTSSFSAGVAPVILWKPTSNIIFETGFDIGLNTDPDTSSSTSFDLTIANVSLLLTDWLAVGGGLFVTPFGVYHNHFDPPWINKFADDPLAFSDGGIAPGSSVGIFARGAELIGNMKIVYDVYVINGPNLITSDPGVAGSLAFDNYSDLNNDKAVGGRIGLIPMPNMELGYSIMSGRVQPPGFSSTHALLQAVDFNYRPDVPALAGTFDLRSEWVWSNVGRATYDSTGSLGFGPVNFRNFRSGGYVQLCYRPTHVNNKILQNLEFCGRWDILKVPEAAPGGGTEQRYIIGVDYWINPQVVLKVDYEFDHRSKSLGAAENALLFQLGIGL